LKLRTHQRIATNIDILTSATGADDAVGATDAIRSGSRSL